MTPYAPDLSDVFDRLFPICRTICGAGLRESLEIMAEYMPIEIHGIESGTQVFDWTVPSEWRVEHAYLTGPDGQVLVDFDDHNLHLVNCSDSYTGEMELEDLQKHLHSLPSLPDAIPYVTSYYQPRWGFCLTHRQRQALKPGTYKIDIKTEKKLGHLNYGVAEIQGQVEDTILVTSYLCHPSMANNELSGPLALLETYHRLANGPKPFHSYRFLLIPETIGSISYLATQGEALGPKLFSGMVMTCLGGPNTSLSFKLSRRDWLGESSPIDTLIRHLNDSYPNDILLRDFTPTSGSDERQFCSPGVNWPMVQAARTKYGQYDEYHTSADDKRFMRIERVEEAGERLATVLRALDWMGGSIKSQMMMGEPQLGRRDLYPSLNSPLNRSHSSDGSVDSRTTLNRLLTVLNLADGRMGLIDMAEKIKCSALDLLPILDELHRKELVNWVKSPMEGYALEPKD